MDMVTAIITTHKRAPEMVERALDSALAQTYQNVEIIVVDDSPADYPLRNAVRELAESKGVTYIAHETCQGACVARNTGIARAKGDFIMLLDDDDEWKPEKVEKQIKGFTSDSIGLVYCGSDIKNDKTGAVTQFDIKLKKGNIFDELILGNFIGPTFPMLRTEVLRSIGGFDPLMQAAQDYDVWLRIAEKSEVNYVNESLAVIHVDFGPRISTNHAKRVSGLERLNEKNAVYLKTHRKARWIRTIKLAPEYAGNKQRGKALRTWFRGFIIWPWALRENARSLYHTLRNF